MEGISQSGSSNGATLLELPHAFASAPSVLSATKTLLLLPTDSEILTKPFFRRRARTGHAAHQLRECDDSADGLNRTRIPCGGELIKHDVATGHGEGQKLFGECSVLAECGWRDFASLAQSQKHIDRFRDEDAARAQRAGANVMGLAVPGARSFPSGGDGPGFFPFGLASVGVEASAQRAGGVNETCAFLPAAPPLIHLAGARIFGQSRFAFEGNVADTI